MSPEHYYPVTCPTCRAWLTEPYNLDVCFTVAGVEIWRASMLDEDGRLIDVDRMVENGYHADTCCKSCGTSLAEHELEQPDVTAILGGQTFHLEVSDRERLLLARGFCRLQDDYFNDPDTAEELTEEHGELTIAEWEALHLKLERRSREQLRMDR